MFTIIPNGQTTILNQFGELRAAVMPLLEGVVPDAELPPVEERPFVQLAHSDITDEDIERVLGYAGILKASAPIGIPSAIETQMLSRSFLIYSLPDLERHLRTVAEDVIAECDRAGGFQAFTEAREVSAFEFLVAGLMECIRWCQTHRAALSIRW